MWSNTLRSHGSPSQPLGLALVRATNHSHTTRVISICSNSTVNHSIKAVSNTILNSGGITGLHKVVDIDTA